MDINIIVPNKPVLTHGSIVCGGMLALVNLVKLKSQIFIVKINEYAADDIKVSGTVHTEDLNIMRNDLSKLVSYSEKWQTNLTNGK